MVDPLESQAKPEILVYPADKAKLVLKETKVALVTLSLVRKVLLVQLEFPVGLDFKDPKATMATTEDPDLKAHKARKVSLVTLACLAFKVAQDPREALVSLVSLGNPVNLVFEAFQAPSDPRVHKVTLA